MAVVHGQVQGVGFRWFVRRSCAGLGLTGWVANDSDGSVRLVAEGESVALGRLSELLKAGPPGAVVERVEARRSPATGEFDRFEIRAGGHRGD